VHPVTHRANIAVVPTRRGRLFIGMSFKALIRPNARVEADGALKNTKRELMQQKNRH
jgi:hypothetical protein